MNYCVSCLLLYPTQSVFCQRCGTPLLLQRKTTLPENISAPSYLSRTLSRWFALAVAITSLVVQALLREYILVQAVSLVILAGCGIIVGRPRAMCRELQRFGLWIERRMHNAATGGNFSRWIVRTPLAVCHFVTLITQEIGDPFTRNGLRLSLWIAAGVIVIAAMVAAVVAIIYVVIVIAVILFVLWLMWKILMAYLGGESKPAGWTKPTTNWFGQRREDIYKGGKKVGEIRPAQDWFGRSREDIYRGGKKVGEMRPTTDLLGNPKKESFEGGRKVGEIRPTTDLLGNPKEDVYRDGKKVGEQAQGTDLLGNPKKDLYGAGHPGTTDEPESSD
jgi:hypothetical protein